MDNVTLAYLAGVIDSDGSISVRRSTYAMRVVGDSKAPNYSERIIVRQVSPEAVELLHDTFGGSRYVHGPSAERGKPLHAWEVTNAKAASALALLLPYLRIKRQQAENCVVLRAAKDASKLARVAPGRGHAGSASRSAEHSAAMENCYLRSRDLNRVGVSGPSPAADAA